MKRCHMPLTVPAVLIVSALLVPAAADEDDKKPARKDLLGLARQIVEQAARIREGDRVQLAGTPEDLAILEELAVEVRKRGAHPLVTLTSDRLRRRFVEDVPEKFDRQTPKLDLALAGLVDAAITLEAADEGALAGVPAARMTAQQKAAEPVFNQLVKRGVRTVFLGNGLYPSETRAKRFGLTQAQLRQVYEAGLAADPRALQESAAKYQKLLAGAKQLHLTSKAGTDLKVSIEGRPALVNDGVLTAGREKKGGAAVMTWLPAGEAYVAPAKGSGDGEVVVPLAFWEGKEIRDLRLTFKAGKLTSMKAKSGLERLEAVYRSHGPGKELLGAIDIGLNPGVKAPAGSKLLSFVAAGTVTVFLGNNSWAGGDNTNPFGLTCHLGDATLKADGKALVEGGKLAP